jgi:hypothetical protein
MKRGYSHEAFMRRFVTRALVPGCAPARCVGATISHRRHTVDPMKRRSQTTRRQQCGTDLWGRACS